MINIDDKWSLRPLDKLSDPLIYILHKKCLWWTIRMGVITTTGYVVSTTPNRIPEDIRTKIKFILGIN